MSVVDESLRYAGVQHLSESVIIEENLFGIPPLPTDHVIIPIRNEERGIGNMLAYLIGNIGFKPSQITLIINGTTDRSEEVARSVAPDVMIYHQDEILNRPGLRAKLEEYGLQAVRLHKGKGLAMFCGALTLQDRGVDDDARIFFVDGDIKNATKVDPIGHLLAGWQKLGDSVKLIKLASQGRDNVGIHTFLALQGNPYSSIGAFTWPLCGQMSLRWGDFKRMRSATEYCVEMALAANLVEEYGTAAIFGEVEIGVRLEDRNNTDRSTTWMYVQITSFLMRIFFPRPRKLRELTKHEIATYNTEMMSRRAWIYAEPGKGPNRLETIPLDGILPSVEELTKL